MNSPLHTKESTRGLMDKAPLSGSGDSGFKSRRVCGCFRFAQKQIQRCKVFFPFVSPFHSPHWKPASFKSSFQVSLSRLSPVCIHILNYVSIAELAD